MTTIRGALLPFACGVLLLSAAPAWASLDKARAAQARGELRTAQIELRNAVRADPNSAVLRAALAEASLDVGEADAAEREARQAIEHGMDRAAGTALLIRAYLSGGRMQDLLRDFPMPGADAAPGLAGRIAAGRAMAQLALGQRDEARRSVADAIRLAPEAIEAQLASSTLSLVMGDAQAAEAAVDAALRTDPASVEALLRKAAILHGRGAFREAADTAGRVIAASPGQVAARLRRAEALMASGEDAEARRDLEVALRNAPGSVSGLYLRAMLRARAQDWRAADEDLQRLGSMLPNLPGALLLQASVKRALGQAAQAEDAARRHVARYPTDPRGARMLATLEMEAGRADAAAGTLSRLASRGAADAEAYDLLGRAHLTAGRPREAAEALQRAAAMAPGNAEILSRLAAAQLAAGNTVAMGDAAQSAARLAPAAPAVRQMVVLDALMNGNLAAAESELARLDPAARDTEGALVLQGTVHALRQEYDRAKVSLDAALAKNPESIGARLVLARMALIRGDAETAERLDGEVLARDPDNADALGRLVRTASGNGPRAAPARAILAAAQAAHPGEQALALAQARVLMQARDAAGAVAVLDAAPLRAERRGAAVPLALAEAHAMAGQWAEAEAASRSALAEDPSSSTARRQLANLLMRKGDSRSAEALIEEGLRNRPNDGELLGTLVSLAQQRDGLDAALALADRLAERPGTRPASAMLRGDLLIAAGRAQEAAQAYASAYAREPSLQLALRQAVAWGRASKLQEAAGALERWLQREPDSAPALSALAQLDLIAGRNEAAAERLTRAMQKAPPDAVLLNNLAWVTQERGGPEALAKAAGYAEMAYYIAPNPEVADTLGWIRTRSGRPAEGVTLLRLAVAGSAMRGAPNPGMMYRLAVALRDTGARDEAVAVLEPMLARPGSFAERPAAERLLTELRAAR